MNRTRAIVIRLALFALVTGGIMQERAHAETVTGLYQFLQPSNTGSKVTGTFTYDNASPLQSGEFALSAFSLSWLNGVNFGVATTSDPRATFSKLPTVAGSALSGALDFTFTTEFGSVQFLGNFAQTSGSIDLIRLSGAQISPDHVGGGIIPVPEPSTFSVAFLGLIGLSVLHRFRRKHAR